jgi:hypothetical protein
MAWFGAVVRERRDKPAWRCAGIKTGMEEEM